MAAARESREGAGPANLNGDSPRHKRLTGSRRFTKSSSGVPPQRRVLTHTRRMARQARGRVEAGRYHVRTRSAGKIPYFTDDIGRTDFCNRVARVTTKYSWRCEAFCLMTTHYHLLLDVPEDTLQRGMHWLNGTYAQQFNRRHGRWGHLAGARYTITAIGSLRQLRNAFRYIVRNPVEAGMCERPQDYAWSSYRGTAGYDGGFWFVDDRELVGYYGPDRPRAQRRLRRFVERDVTDP